MKKWQACSHSCSTPADDLEILFPSNSCDAALRQTYSSGYLFLTNFSYIVLRIYPYICFKNKKWHKKSMHAKLTLLAQLSARMSNAKIWSKCLQKLYLPPRLLLTRDTWNLILEFRLLKYHHYRLWIMRCPVRTWKVGVCNFAWPPSS
jgi:hypothetical protein